MTGKALLIGNSDGIGLAVSSELLKREWKVVGISRSESPIEDPSYEHFVTEVQSDNYSAVQHMLACIKKKPVRYTAPWIVIPLVKFRRWMLRLSTLF